MPVHCIQLLDLDNQTKSKSLALMRSTEVRGETQAEERPESLTAAANHFALAAGGKNEFRLFADLCKHLLDAGFQISEEDGQCPILIVSEIGSPPFCTPYKLAEWHHKAEEAAEH